MIITRDQLQPRVRSAKTRTAAEKDPNAGLNMEGKKNETASCGRDLNCVTNIESSLQSITQQGLVNTTNRRVSVLMSFYENSGLNLGYFSTYFSHTKLNYVIAKYTPQI